MAKYLIPAVGGTGIGINEWCGTGKAAEADFFQEATGSCDPDCQMRLAVLGSRTESGGSKLPYRFEE